MGAAIEFLPERSGYHIKGAEVREAEFAQDVKVLCDTDVTVEELRAGQLVENP